MKAGLLVIIVKLHQGAHTNLIPRDYKKSNLLGWTKEIRHVFDVEYSSLI